MPGDTKDNFKCLLRNLQVDHDVGKQRGAGDDDHDSRRADRRLDDNLGKLREPDLLEDEHTDDDRVDNRHNGRFGRCEDSQGNHHRR